MSAFTRCRPAGLVAAGLLVASTLSVHAAEPPPLPVVEVTGVGEARAAPDMAVIDLTVAREADTAREATSAANEAMTAVLARLRDMGIAERDLQTRRFAIEPRIEYPKQAPEEPRAPRVVGYTARNALTVRVRELSMVGQVIDQAITLGVNQGGDVRFVNENPAAVLREARAAAMTDARDRATTLVEAIGARLGPVQHIAEHQERPMPRPLAATRMMEASDSGEAGVPLASGENTYTVTVQARWAIER